MENKSRSLFYQHLLSILSIYSSTAIITTVKIITIEISILIQVPIYKHSLLLPTRSKVKVKKFGYFFTLQKNLEYMYFNFDKLQGLKCYENINNHNIDHLNLLQKNYCFFFVFPSFNYVGIKKTLNASTYENMLGHGDSKQKQKYAFTSHHQNAMDTV